MVPFPVSSIPAIFGRPQSIGEVYVMLTREPVDWQNRPRCDAESDRLGAAAFATSEATHLEEESCSSSEAKYRIGTNSHTPRGSMP
jgi:hypothetical protein